ncbi:hypothetical protein PIB30_019745 [Stylosanthes scabra]|uniref:Uncharacterized protein n=1 Tax=Stylosanthes scabra TaxID=79078 RepID=A0ABU6W7V2_9FABA|nr:hypothetical protein [Stylosanthes scabra]
MMARTRSATLANGKTKLYRSPTRVSPRLATPDVPAEEIVTSILPPKKRQNYRMTGEGSSRKDTKTPCRRSRRITALYSVTKPLSEEKVVIEISDDSVQQKDTNLEQGEALPSAEGGGGVDLPKNDVVIQNWSRIEPDVGPAGPDQGPPLAAN